MGGAVRGDGRGDDGVRRARQARRDQPRPASARSGNPRDPAGEAAKIGRSLPMPREPDDMIDLDQPATKRDLIAIKDRLAGADERFVGIDRLLDGIDLRFDELHRHFDVAIESFKAEFANLYD